MVEKKKFLLLLWVCVIYKGVERGRGVERERERKGERRDLAIWDLSASAPLALAEPRSHAMPTGLTH